MGKSRVGADGDPEDIQKSMRFRILLITAPQTCQES